MQALARVWSVGRGDAKQLGLWVMRFAAREARATGPVE